MSTSQFVQLHFLTSYPASLLNRDDAGFAKRVPFGGVSRVRVSSQCLKRHWRTYEGAGGLDEIEAAQASVRSRLTFDELILRPLCASGVDADLGREVVAELMSTVLGESPKAAKKKKEKKAEEGEGSGAERLQTGQLTVLGRPEIEFLLDMAKTVAGQATNAKEVKKAFKELFTKEQKKNLKTLKGGAGLDAALFGRMVTSDALSREDAAIHVAHAFTVHQEESEPDYFTAVDDLLGADNDETELGSAHLGTTELTSGLFYGYVCVDVPLLVSNLEGCTQSAWATADLSLAKAVLQRLPRLVATVSPGAKKGSTAPYAYAHLVLAEIGSAQPRTLANSFLTPVSSANGLIGHAYSAMAEHIGQLDQMYGATNDRRAAALGERDVLTNHVGQWLSVDELGSWVSERVGG